MGSGLMGTMAAGMAFGAGSEVAHQGVRAMMGGMGGSGSDGGHAPAQEQVQQQPTEYAQPQQMMEAPPQQENPCMGFNQNLMTCISQNRGEINLCQNYMDMLTQCQRDQAPSNYYQ